MKSSTPARRPTFSKVGESDKLIKTCQNPFHRRVSFLIHATAENYLKSSSLIYCWPSVEIGVGLIACNLPSLSFRAAQALPKKIRQGWKFSLSKLRYAADILPLRLDSKRSRHETQLTSDEEDATALEWYGSRRRPPKIPEQDASVATVSQIPLTHVRPKGNANDEPRSMENGNGEIIQGFDAV